LCHISFNALIFSSPNPYQWKPIQLNIKVIPSSKIKIIVICGPTGVGKTGFAIALAQQFGGEIVGADSMQIYRGMDIGTAKPTAQEQAQSVHHMVDVVDPDEDFDAVLYAEQADKCINQLAATAKVPMVVGGTGLYIKALIHGLAEGAPTDPGVRAMLQKELAASGASYLHQRLSKLDSESAKRIHPNDRHRILRALEVFQITGRSISSHQSDHGFSELRYDPLYIGLTRPREQLYERINKRVEIMLAQGFVDEVRSLVDRGFGAELKSMQSLGYRHMMDFFQGRLTWDEAVRTLKRDHRRYAKRQMTWFCGNPNVTWLAPDQMREAANLISDFINNRSL
jgi:tRNA dimethylallyltransferase